MIVLGVVERSASERLTFASDPNEHCIDQGDVLVVIGPTEAIEKLYADLETQDTAS